MGGEEQEALGKKHNGVESRMRGCWSSRKLVTSSEGSQVKMTDMWGGGRRCEGGGRCSRVDRTGGANREECSVRLK